MNILIFSWRGPGHPNAGGAEISTHEHAKGWVRAGHNVTLFTSYYQGAKREEIIDGVSILREGCQFIGVQWEAFKWYLFKEHSTYDLVVDQFHGIPFFTPLYVRTQKLAFIHEVAKEVWQYNQYIFPFNLFVASIGSRIEPYIFKLYKKIPFLTISKSTKHDLINWGIPEENITIIYNGVNKPKEDIFKKERKTTITFLGVLTKDKGISSAIDIFSYLKNNSNLEFQFWVIGKGERRYVEFIKKRATKLGLNNIKFWGYVNEDRKFDLLGSSYILINPSKREGWGLVVIEAAEVGTPTVAYNVQGLRDSVLDNKTGLLSKDYSVSSLANIILNLLKDKEKYEQLRKNAIKWGNSFSWEKATEESYKLLDKLAD